MNRIQAAFLLVALGATSGRAFASARLTSAPLRGEALRAGETTTLRFAVDEKVEEMEVLLTLAGGDTFSLRVTREMSPGTHELTWRVPNLPTTRARLALRVGNEDGEVVRDISAEFTILPADTEPLEDIRPFHGEWRAGEALEEMPSPTPFDGAPGLGRAADSLRALPHQTDIDRTSVAAPAGASRDGDPEAVEPVDRNGFSTPISPRVPLHVPKRE